MGSSKGIHRLSALAVQRVKTPGMYADGGGLYLQVRGPTSKSWIFRYRFDGRARELGLGPLLIISLAEARERAAEARRMKFDGVDPLELKQQKKAEAKAAQRKLDVPTFDEAVRSFLRTQAAAWKNAKHGQQWVSTLSTYASPKFGKWPVSEIDLPAVVSVLEPIWTTKSETAGRVRGRIEAVLDWARVMGFRSGENPARWKGNLDKVLPSPSKIAKVKHHPALPYGEAPAFMARLVERQEVAAIALQLTILTAARTSEVLGMRWGEVDLRAGLWTIPGERMKAAKEHRVPLGSIALSILSRIAQDDQSALVFPHPTTGRPLSINAMSAVLKRMKRDDITVHGFRSTFRDWAAEQTTAANEVVEAALAHTIMSKTEAAYRRGDLLAKRTDLTLAWEAFLFSPISVSGAKHG